jgi:hypothetical protein
MACDFTARRCSPHPQRRHSLRKGEEGCRSRQGCDPRASSLSVTTSSTFLTHRNLQEESEDTDSSAESSEESSEDELAAPVPSSSKAKRTTKEEKVAPKAKKTKTA